MTPEQREELKQAAEEATGGEWVHRYDPGNPVGVQHGVKLKGEHGMWIADCLDNADKRAGAIGTAGCRNADYIARANPSAILSLIAQVEALTVPQWQPIETAPRTGLTLLLGRFNSMGNWRTMRGQWFSAESIAEDWEDPDAGEEGWYETAEEPDVPNCWAINPTHWMLPPAAPTIPAIPGTKEGA